MAEPITMQKLTDASIDSDTLGEFANEDKMVTARLGREYPSAPMASRLLVENGLLGARPFTTYAKMTAPDVDPPLVDEDYAVVTNDDDISKNGAYQKVGGAYVYQKYNPVNTRSLLVNGVAVAIIDNNDNQTWLQANNEDGGLTDVAEQAIRDKLDIVNKDDVPLLFAVTDSSENLTELQVDVTGCVPTNVLNAWASRMGGFYPTPQPPSGGDVDVVLNYPLPTINGSQTTIKASDTHYRNGELLPFLPDINKAILIGSSSAFKSTAYVDAALKTINPSISLYTTAMSGAVITHQSALYGNSPMRVRLAGNVINSTGTTSVTMLEMNRLHERMGEVTGWIDGVYGKMKAVKTAFTFERIKPSTANTPVSASVEFIPEKGNEYRNGLPIIWIGKNNLTSTNPAINDVDDLIKKTNDMIKFNASLVKRCVIMTHFNNPDTPAVSEIRDRVNRCNRLYKLYYKQNVFDVEPMLLGTELFTALSIIRTSEDIAQQAIGNVPPSLMADAAHLLPSAYEYIANKLAVFITSKNFLGA